MAIIIARHAELLAQHHGESKGLRELRKHVSWYLRGFPAGSDLRVSMALVSTLAELDDLLAQLDPTVPFLPIYAVFMFFPGELWLRGAMVLLAVLLSVFFTASYMEENRQRRLVRHMLPRDLTNPRKAQESELIKKRYLAAHPESGASRTAAAPIAPGREH